MDFNTNHRWTIFSLYYGIAVLLLAPSVLRFSHNPDLGKALAVFFAIAFWIYSPCIFFPNFIFRKRSK